MLTGQIPIVYTYSIKGISYREPTGAIDDTEGISVHTPRLDTFAFTEVLPMPHVAKPFGRKFESTVETRIAKSTFKTLNGRTIRQQVVFEGRDSLLFLDKWTPCYKVKMENVDLHEQVGHYVAYYWFNEEYGFVRFLYLLPEGKSVDIKLTEVPYFVGKRKGQ
ncbi:MAG: hypothetical protein QM642_02220 [Edaphocola sp.]